MGGLIIGYIGLYFYSLFYYYIERKKSKFLDNKQLTIGISGVVIMFIITSVFLIFSYLSGEYSEFKGVLVIILIFAVSVTSISLFQYITNYRERKKYEIYLEEIKTKITNEQLITIKEFYDLKNEIMNINGVYILYNKNKEKYYVGQSKNIYSRVKNHIEGRGNAYLFADLKYGDEFMVGLISYDNQKFLNLNEQEKFYIKLFNAYKDGYNKTHGG